jgi:hypothetical protein
MALQRDVEHGGIRITGHDRFVNEAEFRKLKPGRLLRRLAYVRKTEAWAAGAEPAYHRASGFVYARDGVPFAG